MRRFGLPGVVLATLPILLFSTIGSVVPGPERSVPPGERRHEFYFTRAIYSDGRMSRWGNGSWATDYPKADLQLMYVLQRLAPYIDMYPNENAIRLDDPEVRRYPFLYAVEVGWMSLTPEEITGLRDYLLAGGFLIVDDFWGVWQWRNFEENIRRVLPEHRIVDLPLDHPLFTTYYEIRELLQVPNVGNARRGRTSEQGGTVPHVRGIFDGHGRLMVLINFNTDLGDAWEWAEQPYYPLKYSTYAYQVAVNAIVYAMSH